MISKNKIRFNWNKRFIWLYLIPFFLLLISYYSQLLGYDNRFFAFQIRTEEYQTDIRKHRTISHIVCSCTHDRERKETRLQRSETLFPTEHGEDIYPGSICLQAYCVVLKWISSELQEKLGDSVYEIISSNETTNCTRKTHKTENPLFNECKKSHLFKLIVSHGIDILRTTCLRLSKE